MYVVVEYVTRVAVIAGLIALILVGWLLLLEAKDAVRHLAKPIEHQWSKPARNLKDFQQ